MIFEGKASSTVSDQHPDIFVYFLVNTFNIKKNYLEHEKV